MTDAHRALADELTGDGPVLLFGGTFDPPHRAHIELPLLVKERLGAEWLVFIPAGRSPFKDEGPTASGDDRVAMLESSLDRKPGTLVSRIEIEPADNAEGRPSYTIETLERLRNALDPERELRLLIGADQARSFHKWREHERIADLAEPVVMLRAPDESREDLLRAMAPHWSEPELAHWGTRIVDVPVIDASATRVRELLETGDLDHPDLINMLPGPVLWHIRERRLDRG